MLARSWYIAVVETFVASDFARRRRELLDSARDQAVRVRDSDGVMLRLSLEADAEALERLRDLARLFLTVEISLEVADPSPAEFGEIGWVAQWSPERRERFAVEFRDVLALALALNDPAPVDAFLRASRPFVPPERFDAVAAWEALPAEVRDQMLSSTL